MTIEYPRRQPTQIVILDAHRILTDALKMVIEKYPDLKVMEVVESCSACLDLLQVLHPDVLLMDPILPDGDGLDIVPVIGRLSMKTKILVMASNSEEKTLTQATQNGVYEYVVKNHGLDDLISTIRRLAIGDLPNYQGNQPNSPGSNSVRTPAVEQNADLLTPREVEILDYLAQGLSGSQIAKLLCIAPMTVRTHIRNLMDKLGVHSRLEAVTYGLRHNLIDLPKDIL